MESDGGSVEGPNTSLLPLAGEVSGPIPRQFYPTRPGWDPEHPPFGMP